jgi:hypothetical protein
MLTGIDYLVWQLWPYLLLSLLLGLGWGWYSCASTRERDEPSGRVLPDARHPVAGASATTTRG